MSKENGFHHRNSPGRIERYEFDNFMNEIEHLIPLQNFIPYETIPINSDLLRLGLPLDTLDKRKLRLRTFRNPNPEYESELEWINNYIRGYIGGQYLTSEINTKKFRPTLNSVGYRSNDFVLKLGDQQYLIQYIFADPTDPSPFLPSNSITTSARRNYTGTTAAKTNFAPAAILPLFKWPGDPLSKRYMIRLSTSLADDLGEVLFTKGLEEFLSLTTQRKKEAPIGIDFVVPSELLGPYHGIDHIDFNGAYGTYYQELFFHIPFLIANHLNANQKFKESKWWYERIFDPSAAEPNTTFPSLSSDRVWQYIDFRNLTIQKMREILTNGAAIQMYEKDPFNPHAIARLRSKCVSKSNSDEVY
jgi:hypothetical protein